MEGNSTLSILFLSWWYGERFAQLRRFLQRILLFLTDYFSVVVCLKTLFSVWRKDQIDYHNLSLKEKFQAWTLNMASRLIGFVVKMVTLSAYLAVTAIYLAVALTIIIIWLGFPALIVSLVYLSFVLGRAE